jgi:hypothetical protein
MDNLFEDLFKFLFVIVAAVVVIVAVLYAIFTAIAIAAWTAMFLAGVFSFYTVKSDLKGLVQTKQPLHAFILSLAWASVLTTGCILGSFPLLWTFTFFEEQASYIQHFEQSYGEGYDVKGFLLCMYNWLLVGAYGFFFKTTVAIFVANRTFIARQRGGNAWLGIIPPIGAMLIFFFAEHWDLVTNALASHPHLERLVQELWAAIILPVDLAIQAITNPDAVVQWGISKFRNSDGSIFRLASDLNPTIFSIIAFAFGIRALTGATVDTIASS